MRVKNINGKKGYLWQNHSILEKNYLYYNYHVEKISIVDRLIDR